MNLSGSSVACGGDLFIPLTGVLRPGVATPNPGMAATFFPLRPGSADGIVYPFTGSPGPAPMTEETPQQADDRRLLAEIVAERPDAFAALYDRLSGPLFTLCLRMIGDAGEAEDVLQEVFLTIWRRAAAYDPARASVFGWSVHLTRCKAIDHLRSRGRRLRVLGPAAASGPGENGSAPLPPLTEAAATTPNAADDADRHERAALVRQVLGALPAEQSQVIEMAFFSDLSHHEISARLAQPLGTIKARIRRGLLKLRDGLKRT